MSLSATLYTYSLFTWIHIVFVCICACETIGTHRKGKPFWVFARKKKKRNTRSWRHSELCGKSRKPLRTQTEKKEKRRRKENHKVDYWFLFLSVTLLLPCSVSGSQSPLGDWEGLGWAQSAFSLYGSQTLNEGLRNEWWSGDSVCVTTI